MNDWDGVHVLVGLGGDVVAGAKRDGEIFVKASLGDLFGEFVKRVLASESFGDVEWRRKM